MTLLSQQERRVWTRQPPIWTRAKPNIGLASLATFNGKEWDVIGASKFTKSGSGHTSVVTPAGVGISSAGGLNFFTSATAAKVVCSTSTNFSVLLTLKLNSTGQTNTYALYERLNGGGGAQTAIIYGYVANQFEVYTTGATGADPRTGSGITVSDTNPHTILYTYDGTTWAGYLDGNQVFSTARTFSIATNDATGVGGLLAVSSGVGQLDATVINHATFDRGLHPALARKYSANPNELFASRRTRRYISLGAGGATNYTATLTANITSSAAIIKAAKAQRQANTSAAAAIAKAAATSKAATTTASAALTRSARLTRAATSTITGALATIKAKLLTLTATVTTSATIARLVGAVRLATASASATIKRAITATKTATATTTGVIRRAVSSTKAATTAAAGTLRKLVSSTKAAATTLSGLLSSITTPFSGGGPFVPSLRRMFSPNRDKTFDSPDRAVTMASPDRTTALVSPARDEI